MSFQEKDSASILSFSPYFEGAAPVRIENYCPNISMVSYKQRLVRLSHPARLKIL